MIGNLETVGRVVVSGNLFDHTLYTFTLGIGCCIL